MPTGWQPLPRSKSRPKGSLLVGPSAPASHKGAILGQYPPDSSQSYSIEKNIAENDSVYVLTQIDLGLPFHCVLCRAAPAPAGIVAILNPRYHPAHAARDSVSTPQPPTGQMVTNCVAPKAKSATDRRGAARPERAVLGYALMPRGRVPGARARKAFSPAVLSWPLVRL